MNKGIPYGFCPKKMTACSRNIILGKRKRRITSVCMLSALLVILAFLMGCGTYNVKLPSPQVYKHQQIINLKTAFFIDKKLKEKKSDFRWNPTCYFMTPIGDIGYRYTKSFLQEGFVSFQYIETLPINASYDIVIKIVDINQIYFDQYGSTSTFIEYVVENDKGEEIFKRRYEKKFKFVSFVPIPPLQAVVDFQSLSEKTHLAVEEIVKEFVLDIHMVHKKWIL